MITITIKLYIFNKSHKICISIKFLGNLLIYWVFPHSMICLTTTQTYDKVMLFGNTYRSNSWPIFFFEQLCTPCYRVSVCFLYSIPCLYHTSLIVLYSVTVSCSVIHYSIACKSFTHKSKITKLVCLLTISSFWILYCT